MSDAMHAFGTRLERGDGASPEEFEEIAEVTNISGPSMERETYDSTHHGQADNYRQFIGGLVDPGSVSIDVNYNPSVHDVLVDDLSDCLPRNYRIVWVNCGQDIAEWSFEGIMTGFEPTAPVDDKASATMEIKVSGKPEITPLGS